MITLASTATALFSIVLMILAWRDEQRRRRGYNNTATRTRGNLPAGATASA
jgi:hypothetical protein